MDWVDTAFVMTSVLFSSRPWGLWASLRHPDERVHSAFQSHTQEDEDWCVFWRTAAETVDNSVDSAGQFLGPDCAYVLSRAEDRGDATGPSRSKLLAVTCPVMSTPHEEADKQRDRTLTTRSTLPTQRARKVWKLLHQASEGPWNVRHAGFRPTAPGVAPQPSFLLLTDIPRPMHRFLSWCCVPSRYRCWRSLIYCCLQAYITTSTSCQRAR